MVPLKFVCCLLIGAAANAGDAKKAQRDFEQGLRYEQAGKMQEAYWSFSQALAENPTDQAYLHRARAQVALNAPLKAIDDLSHASGMAPNNAEIFLLRGALYAKQGEKQKALDDLNKAIQLGATTSDAYSARGGVEELLGHHERAVEDYSAAIRQRLDDPEAWKGRGTALAAMGRYRDAIDDYDQSIRLNPNLAATYIERGFAYGQLGDFRRGIDDFDKVLRIDPWLRPFVRQSPDAARRGVRQAQGLRRCHRRLHRRLEDFPQGRLSLSGAFECLCRARRTRKRARRSRGGGAAQS